VEERSDTVTVEVFVDGSSLGTRNDASYPLAAGKAGFVIRNAVANNHIGDWTTEG